MKYILSIAIAVILSSCLKTEFADVEQKTSWGEADFSNYISVGNSLTQGFQDGGLHNELNQQENSYPAILARQMGVPFLQPMVQGSGSGYKKLLDLEPTIVDIAADTRWTPNSIFFKSGWADWDTTLRYNNLAISGIKLTDCLPNNNDVGDTSKQINQLINKFNSYGGFLNWGSRPKPVTYSDHIKRSKPTFFTCWLGNNDVLGWASNGGDRGRFDTIGITVYLSDLTDAVVFRYKYDSVLYALTRNGAKGICATLPDITSIPFFTTITLESLGQDVWITSNWNDNTKTGTVRLATKEDLILLKTKASMVKPSGHGFTQNDPLTHLEVLDKDEVEKVRNHTLLLNDAIKDCAAKYNVPVVDMYLKMFELKSGLKFDGIEFTTEYIKGGAFSLDGVHPNNRGYAMIANFYLDAINKHYGSNLKPVVVHDYLGIQFP